MSKTSRIIVVLIIILAVAAWAVYPRFDEIVGSSDAETSIQNSSKAKSALPVSGVVVKPMLLENKIKVTGSILPNESIELKSEVSGLVTKVHFDEGQKVKKGALLVSLKNDELQAQLEKLKFSKKLAVGSENRQKQLLNKEAISQEEYDISLTALNTIEADIRMVEAQLARTSIVAPFDGVLGLREISEGAYITNSTIITNFYSIDPVKIDFAIPGKYASIVSVGDVIQFETETSTEVFRGTVYAFEPQIDQNTRTLRMRAISSNEQGKLLPGQFAKIELIMSSVNDALMVPAVSVIPELNGHMLFVAQGGKAQSVPVKIGLRTESSVQILEGLNPQDTVITSGLLEIRQGSSISISSLTK
ncbi:efflux RND transporter periplasmic adaptor subunit [uncultured Roseivirga sp.]|uniref:efflux RND transporter periplasmic adaptor subunit n=1 Tax=uncultured Roseivirga sp. TaxID=543088 RepID=UPI0030DD0519|tara:strand:+ start:84608 stop:85690 length:1083 start_codon:yes stop_codon:yes gene_type:complete